MGGTDELNGFTTGSDCKGCLHQVRDLQWKYIHCQVYWLCKMKCPQSLIDSKQERESSGSPAQSRSAHSISLHWCRPKHAADSKESSGCNVPGARQKMQSMQQASCASHGHCSVLCTSLEEVLRLQQTHTLHAFMHSSTRYKGPKNTARHVQGQRPVCNQLGLD